MHIYYTSTVRINVAAKGLNYPVGFVRITGFYYIIACTQYALRMLQRCRACFMHVAGQLNG